MSVKATISKQVPAHLRRYVSRQRFERYTPVDHAVWRYVMRQNVHFHQERAHEAYRDGLARAGIVVERIPRIEEMNASLNPFGWGAVPIDGLIPGVAFFDFQAHGFLPIAADIRRLENIAYTPAPDIIHEAAGHAPILCDEKYAEYVRTFGRIGAKALATREEHDAFLAARRLSQVMENPSTSPEEREEARRVLEEKTALCTEVSEAAQISRLYWWTVEYGLIGDPEHPRIYGAGLLSSLEEGRLALSPKVKKIPFDLETCIRTDYDVTRPQPQLFVCRDFDELIDAVLRFSERMAFRTGGTAGLLKAVRSGDTATAVYDSGLAVSGTFGEVILDDRGEAAYLSTIGPTALSVQGRELPGHGKSAHKTGFGSPVGRPEGSHRPFGHWTEADLAEHGWTPGKEAELRFESGVTVKGRFLEAVSGNGKLVLLRFADARVEFKGRFLFTPDHGIYDMAVGERITSVFAGADDPERFFADEPVEMVEIPDQAPEWTPLHRLYQAVRQIREGQRPLSMLTEIVTELECIAPDDWLLRIEMMELVVRHRVPGGETIRQKLERQLEGISLRQSRLRPLIQNGLKLVHMP
jgi:phenylalanine-4-hydroxylase